MTKRLIPIPVPHDPELSLWLPENDTHDPEITIVIPACNEELAIGDFVAWALAGLHASGAKGEILIVCSSTDRTREIALAGGARVLVSPRRGLGRAYIDALPFIRGRWVLMGDADCTYDFRELGNFLEKFRSGYEFVMGSRFRGYIEDGAMPALHRYLGTPVTTWILNRLYKSHFSDIHCGMRGITRDALLRMELQSQSWEYASEMVVKSVRLQLRTAEVPVKFYKDREGRLSHHKRSGWFSPWKAAWINLRAMFVYGADYVVFRPGLAFLAIGLLVTLPLTFGPLQIGPLRLSLNWMLMGLASTLVGVQCLYLGCLAEVIYDRTGQSSRRWLRVLDYDRSAILSSALCLSGLGLITPLILEYVRLGFTLPAEVGVANHCAVTGLLLVLCAFFNFVYTLVLQAVLKLRSFATMPRPPAAFDNTDDLANLQYALAADVREASKTVLHD